MATNAQHHIDDARAAERAGNDRAAWGHWSYAEDAIAAEMREAHEEIERQRARIAALRVMRRNADRREREAWARRIEAA